MQDPKSLGEKSIGKLLWEFSLPAVIAMIVNALYNVVDSIFVGNGVGELGLAAVTIAFPIMMFLIAFGMLIGLGATAQISLSLGRHNKVEAEKILGNAFSLTLLIGILLPAICLLFLDPILISLGADDAILPYARDFTTVIVAGSIFSHISFGLNNIIRAEGNPRIAMSTMLMSALLNTVLNPLFIFTLKMGISGSAWATILSQGIASIWVLAHLTGSWGYLKLKGSGMKPELAVIKAIFAIGMSPFFMQIAACAVAVLLNFKLMQNGGETAVAAMGIINRITFLIVMPIFGISQGTQPIIGYNYGAQKYDRVIAALKKASIAATTVIVLGFLGVELFSTQIIRLFNDNPELVVVGSNGMQLYLMMLPVVGFQIIGTTYFQAIGKAKNSLFLSLSRQVIILIPLILILPHFIGLNGIWLSSPIADFSSAMLTALLLRRELRYTSQKAREKD